MLLFLISYLRIMPTSISRGFSLCFLLVVLWCLDLILYYMLKDFSKWVDLMLTVLTLPCHHKNIKKVERNFMTWGICLWKRLWWRIHKCIPIFKLIKVYTLNMKCSYVKHNLIKWFLNKLVYQIFSYHILPRIMHTHIFGPNFHEKKHFVIIF